MFNKDYIMRMIEQLVRGIALIMGLKDENRLEECADALTDTLRKFYGLNDQSADNLPWRDLMAVASLGGLPDGEKCALLAQLIKEKADLSGLGGNKELAARLYFKALNIYISALIADNFLVVAEHTGKIDELVHLVSPYALPAETQLLLLQHYELTGRYGKAEDMLYELMKSQDDVHYMLEQGRAFYLRLLGKGDAELANGNLPRNEVEEGLNNLVSYDK